MNKLLLIVALISPFGLVAQNFNMELLGHLEYDVEANDVWGYVDEQDNEYALVGLTNNFSIVDVTDPTIPTEVFRTIGANTSTWRDIKTWGDYAYITCECGPGLLIVDMSPLPESNNLTYTYWNHDSVTFYQAHNLYIDENGIAYIFGAFYSKGGAIMLDLTGDPMDPEPVGLYDDEYLHDGVVRGDTLWGSAINIGQLQVIDVSDKSNPVLMSQWKTPNSFTHNAWFSDDNRYIFTTDEVKNGSIAAYDALNIQNPIELDLWTVDDTVTIPHNVHVYNDFLVTSYYTHGINIIDAKRPNNLIETGRYDTSPDFEGEGYNGCWGAYPYLPSGNILATDIEEGLYVFQADYKHGCYLEGGVTDINTGLTILFPTITILEEDASTKGNIVGEYAVSTLNEGSYTVIASAEGYFSDTINNVQLQEGELTLLDIQLNNWPVGMVEANATNDLTFSPNPAQGVLRIIKNQDFDFVVIYDEVGRLVRKIELVSDIADYWLDLEPGSYSIRAIGASNSRTQRLIITN